MGWSDGLIKVEFVVRKFATNIHQSKLKLKHHFVIIYFYLAKILLGILEVNKSVIPFFIAIQYIKSLELDSFRILMVIQSTLISFDTRCF